MGGKQDYEKSWLAFFCTAVYDHPDEEDTGCTNFHLGTGFRCRVLVKEKGCCHTLTQACPHTLPGVLQAPFLLTGWAGLQTQIRFIPYYKQKCKRLDFSPCWLGYRSLSNKNILCSMTCGGKIQAEQSLLKSLLVSHYDFRIGCDLPSTLSQRNRGGGGHTPKRN